VLTLRSRLGALFIADSLSPRPHKFQQDVFTEAKFIRNNSVLCIAEVLEKSLRFRLLPVKTHIISLRWAVAKEATSFCPRFLHFAAVEAKRRPRWSHDKWLQSQ